MIKKRACLQTKCPSFLSRTMKLELRDSLKKTQLQNFMKIRLLGTEFFHTDGQTNGETEREREKGREMERRT
jgi:hypothetical protein